MLTMQSWQNAHLIVTSHLLARGFGIFPLAKNARLLNLMFILSTSGLTHKLFFCYVYSSKFFCLLLLLCLLTFIRAFLNLEMVKIMDKVFHKDFRTLTKVEQKLVWKIPLNFFILYLSLLAEKGILLYPCSNHLITHKSLISSICCRASSGSQLSLTLLICWWKFCSAKQNKMVGVQTKGFRFKSTLLAY